MFRLQDIVLVSPQVSLKMICLFVGQKFTPGLFTHSSKHMVARYLSAPCACSKSSMVACTYGVFPPCRSIIHFSAPHMLCLATVLAAWIRLVICYPYLVTCMMALPRTWAYKCPAVILKLQPSIDRVSWCLAQLDISQRYGTIGEDVGLQWQLATHSPMMK